MSKISNTTVYPTITPTSDDLLILTDVSDSNSTKTCKVSNFQNINGGGIASVTLSISQILNLHTHPVVIIPAPGAGKAIVPFGSLVITNTFNTTAYSYTTPNPGFVCGTAIYTTVNSTDLTGAATASYAYNMQLTGVNTVTDNNPLLFSTFGGVFTLGDGTITINLQYRIVEI